MFAHSRDPHPAIKLWCQVPFTKSKTIFQIEMYCMQCFLKSKYIKVELSMIKIGELLRKLWSLRSCFLILPPGNIGAPSSDVPAEVELLHMRIELMDYCMIPLMPIYPRTAELLTWISNHMPSKVWDEITYPFPNFSWSLEMEKYFHPTLYSLCNYYPCWDWS